MIAEVYVDCVDCVDYVDCVDCWIAVSLFGLNVEK